MPLNDNEYSTPKITPADGVKIPSVGGNSGYQLDSDLRHYIGDGIMGESDEFSTLLTYTVGSFCIHEGVLYQCAIPITSPGQWDASKWNKIDLKTLNDLIGVVEGGVIPKGDILSTDLPTPSAENKGWLYYCTDLAKNAVSDGMQWVYFSNTMLTSTPDATDNAHALTNAAVTTLINGVGARVSQNSDRLDQHDSRLQNLDQKAGDYTTVQYRGTDAVPTGKAKYGLVKSFVGKTRAWNQLYHIKTTGTVTEYGITFTYNSDGTVVVGSSSAQTATGLAVIEISMSLGNYGLNHKILVMGCPSGGSSSTYWLGGINSGQGRFAEKDTGSGTIISVGSTYGLKYIIINIESGTTINSAITFRPVCYDLTLIFGAGNEPSTVGEALALLSDLGEYNAYDAGSLVDTEVSGVKSIGVNIWDEEWEVGAINDTTGEKTSSSTRIRSKNYISVTPNTSYYYKVTGGIIVFGYDANKNAVKLGDNTMYIVGANNAITTPSNVSYLMFYSGSDSYGTTYKHDIQICLNSYADKTTYHPYKTDTLSLPTPFTGRSAGTVADTDELNVEVSEGVFKRRQTDRVGQVDLGTLEWSRTTSYNVPLFYANLNDKAQKQVIGMLCGRYTFSGSFSGAMIFAANSADKSIGDCYSNKQVFVRDDAYTDAATFKTAMSGVYLNYELADESVTLLDPIIENFLEVEGGGTVEAIQTQTPVIDNCLDVGYLTL